MSDTRALLGRISSLRQRLEGLTGGAAEPGPVAPGDAAPPQIDAALRRLGSDLPGADAIRPRLLTGRVRRLLERGRDLIGRLRELAADPMLAGDSHDDPLPAQLRQTAAIAETAVRLVQALPDVATVQLRLGEGLEGILETVADRVAGLGAAADGRRRRRARTDRLAELLTALTAGTLGELGPFAELAEELAEEARRGEAVQFLSEPADDPARFASAHALTAAGVVARVARLDPDWRAALREPVLAALLMDVGLLGVPAEVLAAAGPLTPEGRRLVEAHPRAGAELIAAGLPGASPLAAAVRDHHERLDGTGYPAGLLDAQIAPLPRLLAVADVYSALCCPRPHRAALDPRTAMTDTLLAAENGSLDRTQAERLLSLSFYPVGSVVELADGAVGVVVATPWGRRDLSAPARPVLALLTDGRGQPLPAPLHLDLAQADSRSIVRTLPPAERRALLGRRSPEWA
jgi:HD domain